MGTYQKQNHRKKKSFGAKSLRNWVLKDTDRMFFVRWHWKFLVPLECQFVKLYGYPLISKKRRLKMLSRIYLSQISDLMIIRLNLPEIDWTVIYSNKEEEGFLFMIVMLFGARGWWFKLEKDSVTALFSIFLTIEAFLWNSQTLSTVTSLHSLLCKRTA